MCLYVDEEKTKRALRRKPPRRWGWKRFRVSDKNQPRSPFNRFAWILDEWHRPRGKMKEDKPVDTSGQGYLLGGVFHFCLTKKVANNIITVTFNHINCRVEIADVVAVGYEKHACCRRMKIHHADWERALKQLKQ